MKKVVILRGIPGSGKSTAAKRMFQEQGLGGVVVRTVSADHYFTDFQGNYQFDRRELGLAHAQCLRAFVEIVRDERSLESGGADVLVLDNTNTTTAEMIPYVRLAQAYGVPFEVVTISCDPELAAARNVHGVPLAKVWEMYRRLEAAQLPKDWPCRTIKSEIK